ncbi:MAG: flagellar type III secretion system protein FliR [Deltaproteobacteria bacterium]|nr:flagellar type III secretion system protein FliR [Deltaproteobacteria bacterium]
MNFLPVITVADVGHFFLLLTRISALIFFFPVLSNQAVPRTLKAAFSMLIALLFFKIVPELSGTPLFSRELVEIALAVLREMVIGLLVGMLGSLLFAAVQTGGNLIGFQMSFSVANVVDPVTSMQVPLISQFYYMLAMLLFLAFGAHRLVFKALAESFTLIPLAGFTPGEGLLELMLRYSAAIFSTAIKIAAPLMAALLLSDVSLGVVARTAPQMNIFIVGMPLKILLGMLLLSFSLPYLATMLEGLYRLLFNDIMLLLSASGGG